MILVTLRLPQAKILSFFVFLLRFPFVFCMVLFYFSLRLNVDFFENIPHCPIAMWKKRKNSTLNVEKKTLVCGIFWGFYTLNKGSIFELQSLFKRIAEPVRWEKVRNFLLISSRQILTSSHQILTWFSPNSHLFSSWKLPCTIRSHFILSWRGRSVFRFGNNLF